jgi:hypothetical protein
MKGGNIILQTATGRDIEHTQELEIDDSEVAKLPIFTGKYGGLVERHPPTGFYNCHGLTFGGRRAWVYGDGNSIGEILEDDAYEEVASATSHAGDVILYFDENGAITHSGIVVEFTITLPRTARVCSKWAQSAEFVHWANQCPYGYDVKYFRVKR